MTVKYTQAFLYLTAALVLGGCATAPVKITGDNYCRLGGVIQYSRNDTPGTVRQVRRSNARYDRVCN